MGDEKQLQVFHLVLIYNVLELFPVRFKGIAKSVTIVGCEDGQHPFAGPPCRRPFSFLSVVVGGLFAAVVMIKK